jgi:Flp pilus assembly pilin Flp
MGFSINFCVTRGRERYRVGLIAELISVVIIAAISAVGSDVSSVFNGSVGERVRS